MASDSATASAGRGASAQPTGAAAGAAAADDEARGGRDLPADATPATAPDATATRETLLAPPATSRIPREAAPRRRALVLFGGGFAALMVLLFLLLTLSHGNKSPGTVSSTRPPTGAAPATSAPVTGPALAAPPTVAPPATPTPTPARPPAAPPPAEDAPTTTGTPAPAEPTEAAAPSPPRPRRTLGGKKVVLEYDPKPTSPTTPPPQAPTPMGEDPTTVARAREAYHKGNVKLFAGDSAGAIALYREALKIYPGYVAGYRGLGLGYEAAGNGEAALEAFHTYVRTVPSANDTPIIRRRIEHLEAQKSGAAPR